MAYDAATSTVLLFGGTRDGDATGVDDTWSWNGSTWTQLISPGCTTSCPSSPPARFQASMAYDPASGAAILYSGYAYFDTWTWDGTNWTQLNPDSGPGTCGQTMSYDDATNSVVWSGCGETWLLAGTITAPPAVTGLSPASGPAAGGTAVAISGSGFSTAPGGTTSVNFGPNAATNVSCSSTTQCVATSPPGSGTVDVWVAANGQTSVTTPADRFSYTSAGDSGSGSVLPAATYLRVGQTVTVAVQATAPPAGLGSWTVDIGYDPSVGSTCNTAASASSVLIAGASATGLTGTQSLASLTLQAVASGDTTSALSLSVSAFADTAADPLTATTANGTVSVVLLGDVNGDGHVNAIDALCVLRVAAQLPVVPNCPAVAPFVDEIAIGETNGPTAVDALCILRGVTLLPATSNCPLITPSVTAATPSPAPALTSSPSPNNGRGEPRRTGATVAIDPVTREVAPGGSTNVSVVAKADSGALGAWAIDVQYEPKLVKVTGCSPEAGSVCNASYKPDVVRISGASATGLSGDQVLASISFEATGKAGSSTPLHLSVDTLADPSGTPLAASETEATLSIGASPTASPTPRDPSPAPRPGAR